MDNIKYKPSAIGADPPGNSESTKKEGGHHV